MEIERTEYKNAKETLSHSLSRVKCAAHSAVDGVRAKLENSEREAHAQLISSSNSNYIEFVAELKFHILSLCV